MLLAKLRFVRGCREEPGLHYGINLRGDNFLVLRARLGGKREPVTELSKQEIVIPPEVIKGTYKVFSQHSILRCFIQLSYS